MISIAMTSEAHRRSIQLANSLRARATSHNREILNDLWIRFLSILIVSWGITFALITVVEKMTVLSTRIKIRFYSHITSVVLGSVEVFYDFMNLTLGAMWKG